MQGQFIAFEGPDGAGTTAHAQLLARRMEREGLMPSLTAEPSSGPHGQRIRRVLAGDGQLSSEELQQLFCEDRAEHVAIDILPALEDGQVVITDRYVPSTLIYGEASGVDAELLAQWNADFPEPDLLIITLPPFAVCQERVERRGVSDILEKKAFQEKVYDGYVRYAAEHSEAFVVDTSGDMDDVGDAIWEVVSKMSIG